MFKRAFLSLFCILAIGLMGLSSCGSGTPTTAKLAQDNVLKHKIGQMLIFGFNGKTVSDDSPIAVAIKKGMLGGVILFDYDYQRKQFDKNIESPEQVKALIQQLQGYAKEATKPTQTLPALPLFVSVDYEGGKVNRLKETYGFPETLTAAKLASLSDEIAPQYTFQMAETLKKLGFNLNFAPVLDLNIHADNPIIGKLERSFSRDPDTVAFYANLFSLAFSEKHIACAYKHFPGHGSAVQDSHLGFVDVTNTWRKEELLPYVSVFKDPHHCHFVMTAHIINRQLDPTGVPATLSSSILTDLLRKQYQFDGLIVTDDMQMKAIAEQYSLEEALVMAINAGADMMIFGNQLVAQPQSVDEVVVLILKNIHSGAIPQRRIEESYQRIVAYKQSLLVT